MEQESVTRLLELARDGDREAFDRAFSLVYDQLYRAARIHRSGETLSSTALINEVWLKLSRGSFVVSDREHFIALASRAMRMIVIDHARNGRMQKRGGQFRQVTLSHSVVGNREETVDSDGLIALDAALQRLAKVNERCAKVVEWRFFGGMTEKEIAEVLGLTERTVCNDWRKARAFLLQEMTGKTAPL